MPHVFTNMASVMLIALCIVVCHMRHTLLIYVQHGTHVAEISVL